MHPSLKQARRAARIRKVVEEVMAGRAAGEQISDASICARHPELMPEMQGELRMLALLERARTFALVQGRSSTALGQLSPDTFEGYTLGGAIHRGGQGVVYEARQNSTGRRVAIKVMRDGIFSGDRDAARFEREVRILGQLEHPGIVGILASGVHAGHFFYVMDYVSGQPLDEYARSHSLSIRQRLELFLKVCSAASAAHLRGVIHRDLKPANILVDGHGNPRILDFGLARITAEWSVSARMTNTGQFIGSMPWASPEQAAGDPSRIDLRTDVYSLGVLLYQLIAGRFPYRVEGGPRDVLNEILTAAPARMRGSIADVGEDLEAIVFKALAKERERRYQSASELADDLQRYLDGDAVLARHASATYQLRAFVRRHRPLVIGTAAVMVAVVLGLVGTSVGLVQSSANLATAQEAQRLADQRAREALHLSYVASIAAADSALRAEDAPTAQDRLAAAPPEFRGWEWAYLSTRAEQSLLRLERPRTHWALVAPCGQRIAQLCEDGTLRIIDAVSLQEQWRAQIPPALRSLPEQVVACFSRDGELLATAHGGEILIWRPQAASMPIATLRFEGSTWGYIRADFSPDGSRLAANGRETRMAVWSIPDGQLVHEFDGAWSGGAAFSPDGRWLYANSYAGLLRLDSRTFEVAHIFGDRAGFRLSPSGDLLALFRGQDIEMLDAHGGSIVGTLRGHSLRVFDVAFEPGAGGRLASVGWDRTVRLWDLQRMKAASVLSGHRAGTNNAGFLADGRVVSSGFSDALRFWGVTPGNGLLAELPGMVRAIRYVDESGIAATMIRGQVLLTPDLQEQLSQRGELAAAAVSGSGKVMALCFPDGRIEVERAGSALWSVDGGAASQCAQFSPDQRYLVTASQSHFEVWDAARGQHLHRLPRTAEHNAYYPNFRPGTSLFAAIDGERVLIIDAARGEIVSELRHPPEQRHFLATAYTADGALLATGDSRGEVIVWDAVTGAALRRLAGMEPAVWSVAFTPDGSRLAAGLRDCSVRLWDHGRGVELLALRGHTATVLALAWSPDGSTLLSGNSEGHIRGWSTAR